MKTMRMIECLIAVIVLLYIAGAILMSCFIKYSGAEPGGLKIPLWPDIQEAVKPYLWAENKQIKILPNNAKL